MLKLIVSLPALALFSPGGLAAENCEALRAQIEANIASKGVTGFTVSTVDAMAEVAGQVVGQCGNGSRKIVYARHGGVTALMPAAPPPQAAPRSAPRPEPLAVRPTRDEDILTECKDGSVSVGGSCKD